MKLRHTIVPEASNDLEHLVHPAATHASIMAEQLDLLS
jgi:hypothetical protein